MSFTAPQLDEKQYRQLIQEVYDRLQTALDSADPDVVDCEQNLGSMVLTIQGKSKWIISAQPSVQQLWLALASEGTAHHFNYDPNSKTWKDDKDQHVELIGLLETYLSRVLGAKISI